MHAAPVAYLFYVGTCTWYPPLSAVHNAMTTSFAWHTWTIINGKSKFKSTIYLKGINSRKVISTILRRSRVAGDAIEKLVYLLSFSKQCDTSLQRAGQNFHTTMSKQIVVGSSKSMKFAYQTESQPIHWPIVFRVRLVCISSRFYKTRGQ